MSGGIADMSCDISNVSGGGVLKLISCIVPPARMAAFSVGQRGWSHLSRAPGFLGQWGGWSLHEPGLAVILAHWRSPADYEHFMAVLHDPIYLASGQAKSYDTIATHLFEIRLPMGSPTDFENGRVIRVADCQVKPDRLAHFEEVQAAVWNPGMSRADGMLGGFFGRSAQDPNHFLVATFWDTADAHKTYRDTQFPALRRRAEADLDLAGIRGNLVATETDWTVVGQLRNGGITGSGATAT